MSKKIITISREYGSGGRQIGQLVSKKLGMDFYDKELIDLAAKEIGFSPELIADKEQRVTNSLLYNFAMGSLYGIAYPSLRSCLLRNRFLLPRRKLFRMRPEEAAACLWDAVRITF